MPYVDDVYIYETEVWDSGDSLRKAAMQLSRAIESYLYDYAHPGYRNEAFLSWSQQHFMATHQTSGMQPNRQPSWDPAVAGHDTRATHTNEGKNHASWSGKSAVEGGIRYSSAAVENPDIDTSGGAE